MSLLGLERAGVLARFKELKVTKRPAADILHDAATTCACCRSTASRLLSCSACGLNRYCSRDCQKEDWRTKHKENCEMDLHFFRLLQIDCRRQNSG
jgi:hypothetical protein